MSLRSPHALLVLVFVVHARVHPALLAQGDPPPPAGGFAVRTLRDQGVTYADGASTRADLRFPDDALVPPPPDGWPVVLLVHGLGGSRRALAEPADRLARNGYFTLAYDVRGQGDAYAFPSTFAGEAERLDLAELVAWIEARHPLLADTQRLGIAGASQGAAHSWAAAALSGKPLPANSRGIAVYPEFDAATPWILAPASSESIVLEGKSVILEMLTMFAQQATPPKLQWEAGFYNEVTAAIVAEDFGRLADIWDNDFWRQDLVHLATSSVPVLVEVSWNDQFTPADFALHALDAMPASTPKRALLTPVGHREPNPAQQHLLTEVLAERWFDRFLKGESNQVELEPRVVTGVVPDRATRYSGPNPVVWNRYPDTWPPSAAGTQRWYLRSGGVLDPVPPAGVEPPDAIDHVVDPSASMAALLAAAGSGSQIEAWIPLSSVAWDTAPLAADVEIAGSGRLTLEVTPNGSDFQLHGALYQVLPGGAERYLQSGVLLVQGDGSARSWSIDLHDLDVFLRAGDRLRLRVENLTRRIATNDGMTRLYRTPPYFDDVQILVEHGAARPSSLDLPIMDRVRPALSLPAAEVETLAPTDLTFELEGPQELAGQLYLVAFGISGITPGFVFGNSERAWLNVDGVTQNLLALLNSPLLPATLGALDASARANPPPQVLLSQVAHLDDLAGLRLIAVAFVGDPLGGGLLPTNPAECFLR